MRNKLSILLVLLLLMGCATKKAVLIGALEDVNVESDMGVPLITYFDQYRTTNVSGILPYTKIGEFYKIDYSIFSDGNPSKSISIVEDNKDQPRKTTSQVVTITYAFPYPNNPNDNPADILREIQKNLLLVRSKAQDVVMAIIKRDVNADEVYRLNKIKKENRSEDETKKLEELTKNQQELNMVVSVAKKELADAELAVYEAINENNVIIAQWDAVKRNNWKFLASVIGTLNMETKKSRSGFVILGGLRISRIRVGTDINDAYRDLMWVNRINRPVVTQLWQAKYVKSVSTFDLESQLKANAKATYSKLKYLSKYLIKDSEFEVDATLSRVESLFNLSNLSNPMHDCKDLEWDNIYSEKEEKDSWNTILAIHTNYSDLQDLVSERIDDGFFNFFRNFCLP